MKKSILLMAVCLPTFAMGQVAEDLSTTQEPPMLGIHWAHGFEPAARMHEARRGGGGSPDMTYHGGPIMPTAVTQPIFWGTSWGSYTGDKITGMDTWYAGFGDSNYAKTSDEYTGSNGQVTPATSALYHILDTSASTSGSNTSAILAEVCKVVTNPDPSGNGYYAVYADTPRGNVSYSPITVTVHAAAHAFSLLISSSWMGMQGATRKTLRDSTRRGWLQLLM